MFKHFSEQTRTILLDSGWYECRNIDPSVFVQSLQADGYIVLPSVENFLREFGGLRIPRESLRQRVNRWLNSGYTWYSIKFPPGIDFDPRTAMTMISREDVLAYEAVLQRSLCPIGVNGRTQDLIFLNESGNVYAAWDLGTLRKIGETTVDGIEVLLCAGERLR